MIDVVKKDSVLAPMLTVVTPILQLGGIASHAKAGVSHTVWGNGVIASEQNILRDWNDYHYPIQEKPLALTNTPENTGVVGIGVARLLQLCKPLDVPYCPQPETQAQHPNAPQQPDDIAALAQLEARDHSKQPETSVDLLVANARGAPNVANLTIVKAENKGAKELDDVYVALHLPLAQRLVYGSEDPKVTSIIVQLHHTKQMPEAKQRLSQLLKEQFPNEKLDIQEFSTLNPFYDQAVKMFSTIFAFISILISAIVLFTVSNTMSMAIVERTVEIGTLRSMGLRRKHIRQLFVTEGCILGITGVTIGIIAAILISITINKSGLTWLPPGQAIRVPLSVRVWGEPLMIMGSGVCLIVTTTLSAWFPAQRASKMNIVEALRYV
jgi:putative ABC transport system permease protein